MVAMEADVLRWMADLLGLPPTAADSSPPVARWRFLRHRLCEEHKTARRLFVGVSSMPQPGTHHALAKAVRLAGFPDDALQLVAVDSKLRMVSAH